VRELSGFQVFLLDERFTKEGFSLLEEMSRSPENIKLIRTYEVWDWIGLNWKPFGGL